MSEVLPDEREYPSLAAFLRAGGVIEIGENHVFGSFARLRVLNTTINVVKMDYRDLAEVLREMDSKAKGYAVGTLPAAQNRTKRAWTTKVSTDLLKSDSRPAPACCSPWLRPNFGRPPQSQDELINRISAEAAFRAV